MFFAMTLATVLSACPLLPNETVAPRAAASRTLDATLLRGLERLLRTVEHFVSDLGASHEPVARNAGSAETDAALAVPLIGVNFCDGTGGTQTVPCACSNASTVAGTGCKNSTGSGAWMTMTGSDSLANNAATLDAGGMPTNKLAFAHFGPNPMGTSAPFGATNVFEWDGIRCVAAGAGTGRMATLNTGASGSISYTDVATYIPSAGTYYFEVFYRDTTGTGCNQQANFSNAWQVTFVP